MMAAWYTRIKLKRFSGFGGGYICWFGLSVVAGVAAMFVVMVIVGFTHRIKRGFTVCQLVAGFE